MKPRQISPQPELLRMRGFKLETAHEPPKIQINEVFSPTMNLNGFGNFLSDPETPTKANASDPVPQPSPLRPPSQQETSPSDSNSSPWSAAVGRATNGKSGRVIERLMGENDRLQREMALACAKYDEELKRSESARSALESVRASNQNLLSMHETDKSLLARKERKIEELKAELESERSKREHAEAETKESRMERDSTVQKLMKENLEEKEQAKRSSTQYDILSKSWKSQEERYDRQIQKLKGSVKTLQDEQAEDKQKLARLDVIMEQLKQEGEKTNKAKESLAREFEAYKREQEEGIKGMRERAERNEEANEKILTDVNTVLGEMKYVVNLKNDFRSSR